MNADRVSPAGLNQSQVNASPVSEDSDFTIATTAKMQQHRQLEADQDELHRSVVVMPR